MKQKKQKKITGVLGASGLIGYGMYSLLKKRGEMVVGTYYGKKKDGLVPFNLLKDTFSVFDRCSSVIISGAVTKIDECVTNAEVAYAVNVQKTIELIEYLLARDIKPVFLSSDQVFDGTRGNYREEDPVNPVNRYGTFKVMVEGFLQRARKDYLILRLSKIYTRRIEEGGMFADIVGQLQRGEIIKAATDKIFNPTEVGYVCRTIDEALQNGLTGMYHCAEARVMSSYDFVRMAAQEYGYPVTQVEAVTFDYYRMIEKRALNSSLNVEKLDRAIAGATAQKQPVKIVIE